MSIAELSLKRPVSTIMFFISLMVIGAIAAVRLPLEYFPAVDAPFVFVNIPYPGSTPAEIERTITRPVEEALSTIPGIRRMNSSSRPDAAQIFMQFDWGEQVAIKASEVRDRIDAIRADLPSDLQRYLRPEVLHRRPARSCAVRLASEQDLGRQYDVIDKRIKRRIERVPGIARVEINGIAPPEARDRAQRRPRHRARRGPRRTGADPAGSSTSRSPPGASTTAPGASACSRSASSSRSTRSATW